MNRGGPWILLPARLPYPLPHSFRLRGPGSTPCSEVEPGLTLAAAAPLAAFVIDLLDLVAQVESDCCMAGEELVVATG